MTENEGATAGKYIGGIVGAIIGFFIVNANYNPDNTIDSYGDALFFTVLIFAML